MSTLLHQPVISCEKAVAIAWADAEKVYDNLSRFRIEIQQEEDGWHITFRMKIKLIAGGGPQYLIDSDSGAILSKRYYQ